MSGAARLFADTVAYAARRRGHDLADAVAATEMESRDQLGLPAGLRLNWLGVAGFELTFEGYTLLIDPYVTRLDLGDLVRRRVVGPDRAEIDRWVPPADAILLGHTHFDHALDAPAIARRDGCPVYGGASAATLMGLHGLSAQAVEVEPRRVYELGPFEVTFVPSTHAKLLFGKSVPNGGEITCEHVSALAPQAYGCGQVWGIHIAVDGATLYHQGSADLIDDEVRHRDVDVFLCAIAGRQMTERYLPRMLGRLQPRTVVATHYDDFLRPLGSPEGFAFGVDLSRLRDEVDAVTSDIRVVTVGRVSALAG